MPLSGNGDIIWPDLGVLTDDGRAVVSLLRLPGSPFVESGLLPRPASRRCRGFPFCAVSACFASGRNVAIGYHDLFDPRSSTPGRVSHPSAGTQRHSFLVNHLATLASPQLQLRFIGVLCFQNGTNKKSRFTMKISASKGSPGFSLVIEHDDQIVGLFVVSSDFSIASPDLRLAVMNPRFGGVG